MSVNIDEQEIAKFDAVASNWWDEQGEFKPLHQINPLRLAYIERQSGALSGKSVVDIGCGGGILSESLARAGAKVCGIDMSAVALGVAREHASTSGLAIDYQNSTAEQLAASGARFDVVCCMEMLEHVPDPEAIVAALAQLANPNGHIFISTINRNPKAWLFAIAGAEYILNLVPRGTHAYKKFIKPSELDGMLQGNKLKLQHLIGLHHNPLTGSFWLADNVDVNYMLHARP